MFAGISEDIDRLGKQIGTVSEFKADNRNINGGYYMSGIKHCKIEELEVKHKSEHDDYEYYRRDFVPMGYSDKTRVSIYEIPPLKSAYPYHFHHKNEETFYIIRGEGVLKTPSGEKKVTSGDLLFFPSDSSGAHKLTNASKTENLVYIDFDVIHDLDVAVYPDSDKIGIWGKGINKVYYSDDDKDYYDGE